MHQKQIPTHASEYTGKLYRYSALSISTGCPSHTYHPFKCKNTAYRAQNLTPDRAVKHQTRHSAGYRTSCRQHRVYSRQNTFFTQRYNCCILPVCTVHAPYNKQKSKKQSILRTVKKSVINLPPCRLCRLSDKNADAIQHYTNQQNCTGRYPDRSPDQKI